MLYRCVGDSLPDHLRKREKLIHFASREIAKEASAESSKRRPTLKESKARTHESYFPQRASGAVRSQWQVKERKLRCAALRYFYIFAFGEPLACAPMAQWQSVRLVSERSIVRSCVGAIFSFCQLETCAAVCHCTAAFSVSLHVEILRIGAVCERGVKLARLREGLLSVADSELE